LKKKRGKGRTQQRWNEIEEKKAKAAWGLSQITAGDVKGVGKEIQDLAWVKTPGEGSGEGN